MLDQNQVSNAVLNMYDIRNALSKRIKNKPLNDDAATDYSIGDCIDDVILFLEGLQAMVYQFGHYVEGDPADEERQAFENAQELLP